MRRFFTFLQGVCVVLITLCGLALVIAGIVNVMLIPFVIGCAALVIPTIWLFDNKSL